MSAPTPTAQGDLGERPLAHVLVYLDQHGLSGTLAVWPDPVDGDEAPPRPADRVLVRDGMATAGRLVEGASALDRGLLALFSRTQAPYAFYGDLDLVGSSEDVLWGPVDLLGMVAASLRGSARDEAVAAVLDRFEGLGVRVRGGTDGTLQRFAFQPKELAFLDLLRSSPGPVPELVTASGLPEKTARRLVYLLAITRCLETFDATARARSSAQVRVSGTIAQVAAQQLGMSVPAPAGSLPPVPPDGTPRTSTQPKPPAETRAERQRRARGPEPAPPAPPELSAAHRELWEDIRARVDAGDKQTFFQVIGVDKGCTGRQARDAYHVHVKRFHPDRLPPELAPLLPFAQRLFHQLTEAANILGDDEKRLAYIKTVQEGGGTPESDRKIIETLDAANELEKARMRRKQRKYGEALEHVRASLELNADDAYAYLELAWNLALSSDGDDAPLDEALSAIERSLGLHEKHADAYYLRGVVHRRLAARPGNAHSAARLTTEAEKSFRRAVELDPKHVDAQREVRILDMRSRSGGKPDAKAAGEAPKDAAAKDGGLFGKLFGGGGKKT